MVGKFIMQIVKSHRVLYMVNNELLCLKNTNLQKNKNNNDIKESLEIISWK